MSLQSRIVIAGAGLFLSMISPLAAQNTLPPVGTAVVYINSVEVMQDAPGSAEAQQTFQSEFDAGQSELQVQAVAIDSLLKEYQATEVILTPEAKAQKQQTIRERQAALQTRRAELNTELGQRQQELLQPILDRASNVIEAIRIERQYGVIFDFSSEAVITADPSLNLTAEVVSRLKNQAE
ncbi:MAG: OmpH family outer membrane protein [Gemmatimonadota bacterium]